MITRLKLKPGQKGTKELVEIYGDSLICVRYRYDEASRTRIKTVELIVDKKELSPLPHKGNAEDAVVAVKIAYSETNLKNIVKSLGGRWDPEVRLWYIAFGKIKGTVLEKHIILDAGMKNRSP